jgi:hypothetical protein
MPLPFVANPIANTELPKVQAGMLVDGFDADRDGVVPDQWTLFFSSDSQANGRTLRNSTSVENRLQIALPPGVNWVMECEFVLVSGTPDESFQLYNSSQDNANKYICRDGQFVEPPRHRQERRQQLRQPEHHRGGDRHPGGRALSLPLHAARDDADRRSAPAWARCRARGSRSTDSALSGPFYVGLRLLRLARRRSRGSTGYRIARLA